MERIPLRSRLREDTGKKSTKELRNAGFIPAVVYKEAKETEHIQINERELFEALHTKAGGNVLINLKIEGETKTKERDRVVIIKEIQHHPIRDLVLHVDFQEISLTEKLEVDVPIAVKGEAEGVTKDEGVLEHVLWEVKVECLPTDIPEKIEVDVTKMKIGDSVLVKDLEVSSGVKILVEPEQTVLSVVPPHVEKPPEEVAAEEITEPELIKKEKEEEVPEEEEGKAAPEERKEEKKAEGKKEEKKEEGKK